MTNGQGATSERWRKGFGGRSGGVRRSFSTWQVPRDICLRLGLADGMTCGISVQLGALHFARTVKLTSGCEFILPGTIGEQLRGAALAQPSSMVEFEISLIEAAGVTKDTPRAASHWSRVEVEAIVSDYLSMLESELAGAPYSKSEHRRRLTHLLKGRSDGSIEFKHSNISAVMIDLGFPYVPGYVPRFNYQELLHDVVASRMAGETEIDQLAAKDAEEPAVVPALDDILEALTDPPAPRIRRSVADTASRPYMARHLRTGVNYLEVEARNRSLGRAGEEFVVRFEEARLIRAGRERLASKIDHLSVSQGDGAGFDILSFEESGMERFIEVKTTRNGKETPFFLSRNEVEVSRESADKYYLYRVFEWRTKPRLFTLAGALAKTCAMEPDQYIATVA